MQQTVRAPAIKQGPVFLAVLTSILLFTQGLGAAEPSSRGAKSGLALSLGLMAQNSSSQWIPIDGLLPSFNVEKSVGSLFSLKAAYVAGQTSRVNTPDIKSRDFTWGAGAQLRIFPLGQGKLKGLFAGLGVDYLELIITERAYSTQRTTGVQTLLWRYSDIGSSWAVGPVLGYQWILGRGILIAVEGDYRYHTLKVPVPGGQDSASSLDMKVSAGWMF